MFRRSSIRYAVTPQPDTPYQRAAQVWDERIGSARVQAHNWRRACLAALGLSTVLAGGLVWQAGRGTVVPWVVAIDRLGEARAIGPAEAGYTPSDPQIAFHLARFIEAVRSLPADPVVVRQNWLRAYDSVSGGGSEALGAAARADDPFARVGKEQVAVDVTSVVRASPSSFRIAWSERHYRDGTLATTERWSAIVTVTVQTPRTAEALRKNPLGLFITAINWSKDLTP